VIKGIEIQRQSDGARFEITYSSGKPESITSGEGRRGVAPRDAALGIA
jgi:hypothetical protein